MILGKVLRMMSHLGGGNEDDFPGGKATEPLQKEKQSKNQIKIKEKEKGQNPGCYKPSPLKEISSSRFGCSGNKYDLRTPFPTRVSISFIYCSPENFR